MHRLFEFSDQRWLPRVFRDLLTELLQHQYEKHGCYRAAVPKLDQVLLGGPRRIVDLCSGSGGPLPSLAPQLGACTVTLSDRHPNRRAVAALKGGGVQYLSYAVDARAVPRSLVGCRTMFTSFHHFAPQQARRILEDAARARAPIAVFEFTGRESGRFRFLWRAARLAWRDTLGMRPRRWSRVLWTHVLPVVPLLYAWDAIVSHRRTYTPAELRAMTDAIPDYRWEIGTLPADPVPCRITYLIGRPA